MIVFFGQLIDRMNVWDRIKSPILFCSIIALFGMIALPRTGFADTGVKTGEAWLEGMVSAMQTQSYRGVFVYSRGGVSSSMKVIHRYKDGIDRERLVQLDGEMGEILRTGDEVVCILPGNRMVSLEQSIPSGPFAGAFARTLMPKKENYMITVKGEDRVAGHRAVKVAVMAKDGYRYNYLLWLEKKSGLLLKSLLLNAQGDTLERFHYTSLELSDDIADAELETNKKGEVFSHERVPMVAVGSEWPEHIGWKVDWLPEGFMRTNEVVRDPSNAPSSKNNTNTSGGNVQVFSDGLASFSVFIEKPGKGNMPEGASVVGATVAYAHRLKWKSHDYMVTVVGEVPVTTAMKVAETVVPKIKASDMN
jgi:sigma-E factor negative regulatory protein RseB